MAGNPKENEESWGDLPSEPINRVLKPITQFLHVEAASGFVLLGFSILALILANSPWAAGFLGFWKTPVGFAFGDFEFRHSLQHLINDGAMAIFFFAVGLEVKREIVLGELREVRRALLPVAGALGGMIVPAGIYLAFMSGTAAASGWGIPMATDIAFVVGCMALLGPKVPHELRVVLLSLAIIDDIGAILVIAFGYTTGLDFTWLGIGAAGLVLVNICSRLGVRAFGIYILLGIGVWFAFHESGVHATIAGVILGLMTPARSYLNADFFERALDRARRVFGSKDGTVSTAALPSEVSRIQYVAREFLSPLEYLLSALHPWVAFVIMPLFAFANAGVAFQISDLGSSVSVAVMAGLVVGKPVGILVFCWLFVRFGLTSLPRGITWTTMIGAGCLAGIGFTMALFIASLALSGELLDTAKIGILAGSVISAVLGMLILSRRKVPAETAAG
jgi:NhaA family Na+:H+ antiporter